MKNKARVSIIMEWENIFLTDNSRTFVVLQKLIDQIQEFFKFNKKDFSNGQLKWLKSIDSPIELLLVYPDKLDGKAIQDQVSELLKPSDTHINILFISSGQREYFGFKNDGVKASSGDIVIFLDSDVIPQPGWFQEMILSFSNPGIQIVGGSTYIDRDTILSKSFGLVKFHMPYPTPNSLIPTYYVFANNFGFRRSIAHKTKFPPIKTSFKLPITEIVQSLRMEGIPVYRNTKAVVLHPCPLWKNYFVRAFFHGRDELLNRRNRKNKTDFPPQKSPYLGKRERILFIRKLKRIARYREIGISTWEFPIIAIIISCYYIAAAIGFSFTRIFPKWSESLDYLVMTE